MDAAGPLGNSNVKPIIDQDASGEGPLCGRPLCNAQRFASKGCQFALCQILLANLHPVDISGDDLFNLLNQRCERISRL